MLLGLLKSVMEGTLFNLESKEGVDGLVELLNKHLRE